MLFGMNNDRSDAFVARERYLGLLGEWGGKRANSELDRGRGRRNFLVHMDAFEHLLCGASAVQIGTALVEEGLPAFSRLEKELSGILDRKGYESPAACSGKLKEL